MKKETYDTRETLSNKLYEAGIDEQKAFLVALDTGAGLVDKEYLIDLGLTEEQLKVAESLVKDFYWKDF